MFRRMSTPAKATNREVAKRIIEAIVEGKPLTEATREAGITIGAFHYALSIEHELAAAYARAQEIRADVLVDEAIAAADSDEDPAKVRNKITIRQWAASKYHSKKFGERIDVNVSQTISVNGALEAAKARLLRPVCDQLDITDVETIEPQRIAAPEPSDAPSAAPEAEPDIFS
jgi:hypothetical protein